MSDLGGQLSITLLCGGVGGARAALALSENFPSNQLTFIVNTGDDFLHMGLEIWPDWDTVVYHLSQLSDDQRGWGRADEGLRCMEEFGRLRAPIWFHLGDRDLALHVYRTWQLKSKSAHRVASDITSALGIPTTVLRVTEESLATSLLLKDRTVMDFQTWFVGHQSGPEVQGVLVPGAAQASVTPGVLEAIASCDLLLFAPSNPFLSLDPILKVPAVAEAVARRSGPKWGISPLWNGKAVKGPLDSLLAQIGTSRGQQGIVDYFRVWVDRLLLPESERVGLVSGDLALEGCRTLLADRLKRREFCTDLKTLWSKL